MGGVGAGIRSLPHCSSPPPPQRLPSRLRCAQPGSTETQAESTRHALSRLSSSMLEVIKSRAEQTLVLGGSGAWGGHKEVLAWGNMMGTRVKTKAEVHKSKSGG